MDWDKLRTFHIVAEAGSFTHAGATLDLSQSAVSRQISALEESLDVKLFHRHARGLVLTEAGELLSNTAKEIFGKLAMVEARLTDNRSTPSGKLSITAPGFLGSTWLVPRMTELKEKYPDLQISLLLDNRILNLAMREADAAVRLYKPDQADLTYKSLGKIGFHICGSKSYFKKYGTPETIKDLKKHTVIGYPQNVVAPYEDPNWLFRKANIEISNNPKVLQMNSLFGIFEAVRNGAGLASLPDYLVNSCKDIDPCLSGITPPAVEMFFVYAEERKNSTRIKVLQDFLVESAKNSAF
ncbi:MAG TPA: LysR family transcriptional regulator [Alphaproteobacteria bacterium]|nr:LysR family transcriptional regulator [Alphaproteobacteria bacterium]